MAIGLGTAVPAADPPPRPPIAPRKVFLEEAGTPLKKVVAQVAKQTGLSVSFPEASADQLCDAPFGAGRTLWEAVELLADQTGNRVVLHDNGRKVALAPRGKSREVSAVSGAFRVVTERVNARYLLDDGVTAYDLSLLVHWEPRFPVFRIDAEPTIVGGADDRGVELKASGGTARSHPVDAARHSASVRIQGLTRESRKVASLEGRFTVTASEKMLSFTVADPAGRGPATLPTQDGVTATLKRFARDDGTWEAELEFVYPPKLPEFESFESWTTANRARLVGPDGKVYAPTDHASSTNRSRMSATYFFKEGPGGVVNPTGKGWALVCDVPSPPVEFSVPFELKEIPLP